MLRVLLAKDLRRVWRNPLPMLINVALPLCITALIGLAFGGADEGELGRIRFAVVDEDDSMLSGLLRSAVTGNKAREHLDAVFLDRSEALAQINDSEISAALVIPTNFTRDYFGGRNVEFELVKNPMQAMQPAVLEELAGIMANAMNGLSRNFQAAFENWESSFEGDVDRRKIAALIENPGDRFDSVRKAIDAPLVGYEKQGSTNKSLFFETKTADQVTSKAASSDRTKLGATDANSVAVSASKSNLQTAKVGIEENAKTASQSKKMVGSEPRKPSFFSKVFAWVLVGMSAMFLLFLANNAMTDLQREMRFRTFERYQTMREQLLPFVLGKVIYAVVFLLICAAVMIGGGGLIFGVRWEHPLVLATLTFAYVCCAAGIMALLMAVVLDESRASTLNSVVGMVVGIAGGCTFPPRNLPGFVREHITPLLPSYWFVNAAREIQDGAAVAWGSVVLKLLVLSAVLIAIAVVIFQRKFKMGLRG